MTASDAFTHASPTYQLAQRNKVLDRSAPIVSSRETGALPNPTEFDPDPEPTSLTIGLVIVAAIVAAVTLVATAVNLIGGAL